MTDIVMNLFIFFFISFSLLYTFNPHKESKIEVKLPEGQVQDASKGENTALIVSVTSGNEIYIGKSRVLPANLKQEISQKFKSAQHLSLLVRADKAASVDYLVRVLDTAKQLGIQKLGVAVEQNS